MLFVPHFFSFKAHVASFHHCGKLNVYDRDKKEEGVNVSNKFNTV